MPGLRVVCTGCNNTATRPCHAPTSGPRPHRAGASGRSGPWPERHVQRQRGRAINVGPQLHLARPQRLQYQPLVDRGAQAKRLGGFAIDRNQRCTAPAAAAITPLTANCLCGDCCFSLPGPAGAITGLLDGKAVVAVLNNGDTPAQLEFQLPVETAKVTDLLADTVGAQEVLVSTEWDRMKVQLPSNYATLLRVE